jgi:uncharacterized protein with von Willebrand factor type A (vWA) domain
MIALLVMEAVLEAVLDTFDEVFRVPSGKASIEAILEFKTMIIETLGLHGRMPGATPVQLPATAALRAEDSRARSIHEVLHKQLVPRLADAADEIADSADALELISLLSAGRGWDHAMVELRKDHLSDIKRYSDIVRRSPALLAMLEDLGRASRGSVADRIGELRCGRSEVHSVITSRDLHYLLPSELIKLRDDLLKYLFFARWTEGKLLTYQLAERGSADKERLRRRGPVVALVDTSGSMDGAPGIIAKAIMLATVRKFLSGGRKIKVALFSSVDQLIEIDLPDSDPASFLTFLQSSFGGGTDLDTALKAGIAALKGKKFQDADILFITDGMAQITDHDLIDQWRQLKETSGSQIFTVIVGNDHAGGLEDISDRVYLLGGKGIKI